ncbi:hypothetical protein [Moorena producens]|nr:hypothetical protein [Moorena producens]
MPLAFRVALYSNPKSIERMFVPCSLLPAPCSLGSRSNLLKH